jgi:hypothetical protein
LDIEKWKFLIKMVPEDTKVVAIQETHCDARKVEDMNKAVRKRWVIHWGIEERNNRGVALVFNKATFEEFTIVLSDSRRLCIRTKDLEDRWTEWWSVYGLVEKEGKVAFLNQSWQPT